MRSDFGVVDIQEFVRRSGYVNKSTDDLKQRLAQVRRASISSPNTLNTVLTVFIQAGVDASECDECVSIAKAEDIEISAVSCVLVMRFNPYMEHTISYSGNVRGERTRL